jgi:hypothetical protein
VRGFAWQQIGATFWLMYGAWRRPQGHSPSGAIVFVSIGLCALTMIPSVGSAASRPSGPSPQVIVAKALATWRADLKLGADIDRATRFPNLSPETLRTGLAAQARRYGFRVVSVDLLRPRQLAPLVVVETSREQALASATAKILNQLDPPALPDHRLAFEGIFFEALGPRGVPFSIAYNNWRGGPNHTGGGQWAASPTLLPLPDMIK